MENEQKDTAASVALDDAPLAAAFPGKTIKLSDGSMVKVHKWTARQVVHEVPALFGRIAMKIADAFGDNTSVDGREFKIAQIMGQMASEAAELVAFTTKKPIGELMELDADEFLMLVRETVEVNARFFGEIANLYALAKRDLPGT